MPCPQTRSLDHVVLHLHLKSYFRNTVDASLIIIKIHIFTVLRCKETHACFIHWSSVILAQDVNTIPNNITSFFLIRRADYFESEAVCFFLLPSTFRTLPPIRELSEKHITTHDKLLNVFEYLLPYKSHFSKWTIKRPQSFLLFSTRQNWECV